MIPGGKDGRMGGWMDGKRGGESGQRPQGVSRDIQVDLSKGEGE